MAKKQRIGILGGVFDPVLRAHIETGLYVLNAGYLDLLLVMPFISLAGETVYADAEDRWRMIVSACACDKRLIPSRVGSGCSCIPDNDTLQALKKDYPGADFLILAEADKFEALHSAPHYKKLLSKYSFLVISRTSSVNPLSLSPENSMDSSKDGHITVICMAPHPVSSADPHSFLSDGQSQSGMDIPVLEYCMCKGLYGFPGRLEHIDTWMHMLFSSLKPGRFAHSLSVAYTAKRLAVLHGIDPLKAEQAGLLHDCAKCLPLSEMQLIATTHSLTDDQTILDNGSLLHSLVGAQVAEDRYGMTDPEVLEAIRYHNTGFPGMSRLAICVCLSDSIEPLRQSYPHLEKVRSLAESSLESALLLSLEGTAEYVQSRGRYLHPRTRDTILWLKQRPAANSRK